MKYLDNIINDNILQNYIINGDMCVYQRKGSNGNTPIAVSSSAYTIDRFKVTNNSASVALTVSQVAVSDTERILVGAEKLYWLNIAGTSANAKTEQRIENLRQFCGKTMICSMWVVGTVGDTILPSVKVSFGTGGAISEDLAISDSSNTTITTTGVPQKMCFIFTVPVYTGYIFGADNTSYLGINIIHQSSGTSIRYTGWQLNIGNSVVPFTLCSRNPYEERRLCERYYEKSYPDDVTPGAAVDSGSIIDTTYAIGGVNYFSILLRVPKRIPIGVSIYPPSVSSTSGAVDYYTGSAKGQATTVNNANSNVAPMLDAYTYGGTGTVQFLNYHYVADAEL